MQLEYDEVYVAAFRKNYLTLNSACDYQQAGLQSYVDYKVSVYPIADAIEMQFVHTVTNSAGNALHVYDLQGVRLLFCAKILEEIFGVDQPKTIYVKQARRKTYES